MNEVEAAGNTPLHAAAYQDWPEGVELLVKLGAKVCLYCTSVTSASNALQHVWQQNVFIGLVHNSLSVQQVRAVVLAFRLSA